MRHKLNNKKENASNIKQAWNETLTSSYMKINY